MNDVAKSSARQWWIVAGAVVLVIAGWRVYWKIRDPSGASVNDMRWTEPVQLASGETIRIRRHIRFRQGRALGGGWAFAPEYKTSTIDIESTGSPLATWDAPLVAMLVDRDPATGEWLVIASQDDLTFWNANGKPCPPQWAFRLRRGVWFLEPVPVPMLSRIPNLLVDVRVDDDRNFSTHSFETVLAVRRLNQLSLPTKISPAFRAVGAFSNEVGCREGDAPRFLGRFYETSKHGFPDLYNFPRE
jgi:hypothetical protein